MLRLAVVAASATLLLAPLTAQTAQPRLTRPIQENSLVTLGGTVNPLANAGNDLGAAPDALPLDRLQVVLKRSDAQESALRQLIGEMHAPGSANYHKWLTPEQFGQQFGPSDADLQTLETWLQAKGFSIGALTPGRQVLEISGTAATFRNAFHASIHSYSVNGQRHYANAGDPQIPAALAPVFGGFVSLNNFPIRNYSHLLGHATYDPATHQAKGDWTVADGTAQDLVLAPSDYAVQYDIPNGLNPAATPTVNGAGQTIAIINDSNINVYLVNRFRALFGLPANPPQVIIDGNDPGVDGNNNPGGPNGDSLEAYLDVEWAGAVAPNATIDLVIGGDTNLENGLILALEHAIYSNLAPLVSVSFGNCEFSLGSGNQFLSGLYQQAAAEGITVMVSSGDSGSAGCDNDNTSNYAVSGQAVNGFASTPYNVAVGGTDFYYQNYSVGGTALANEVASYWNLTNSNSTAVTSIKGVIPEQPWNNSQFGLNVINSYTSSGSTNIVGAGGGASTCGIPSLSQTGAVLSCVPYAKPVWQAGVAGIPADAARDLPDLSLFAANGANDSFYPVCVSDGDCQAVASGGQVQISGVGGTSASTPAFAGMMALVNQKYGRQGQANYVLYPLARQFPAVFHDVKAGTNAVPCLLQTSRPVNCIATTTTSPANEGVIGTGTTREYDAGVGFDLASGLGTVDANVLLANWNKVTFNATTTTLTPSATSLTHGGSLNITGSVTGTGTPTGVVELMTDSSEISQQAQLPMSLSSGSFSANNITTLPGGTYHVWGQYSGDSTNAASTSAKTTITVSPENSGIFFLTTTPTSGGIQILTDPTSTTSSNIPYGTELTLFGLVAPSTQLAAFESCEVGNGTCPVFTPPTGTVTFQDQGATINAAVVNSEADAEFSYPFGVGTHSFTAQYSGDNSYNASSATAQTLTVVPSAPFLGLNIASNNAAAQITSGQATILHVYAGNNYNAGSPVVAPTGSVTLTGLPPNVNTAITVPLVPAFLGNSASYGVGSVPINITAPNGNYPVTIRYPGDSNYTAASTQVGVQVLAAATGLTSTTTASTSASATSAAAAVTVTVTVTGQSGHAAPTGTLSLFSSAVGIGVVTLPTVASGSSVSTSFKLNSAVLVQGNNLISIWYSGDSTYLPSSADITVTNSMADFSLTPASSVAGVPGSGVTTDLISLASLYGYSGGVNLSCSAPAGVTCSLTSPTVTLAAGGVGSSTLNINTSGVSTTGSYPILVTASDAGTGTIVHTLSVTANVTSLPSGGSFGLTNSGTITLASPGASGTATVTVTPTGGFTGSVALSCGVTSSPAGAVKGPTCSVSSPVSVTGTTAGTATLTVNTVSSAVHGAPLEGIFGFGGAAVAMLLFFGLPRRRAWRGVLGMVFAAALMLGASGCGSGSSNGGTNTGTPPPTNNGTTFGSYNITVTGTSGSITTTTVVTVVVN